MGQPDLRVSVCMITYNHERFIAGAIEGVMMQQTNFPVQLIIGEDCSTDNTRRICIEYQQKYPDRITLRLPEKNLGGMNNFLENLDACLDGFKYVAMCEGDDYWIDPLKLQKQVDYLESHPDCGLVYTDVKIYDDPTRRFIERKHKPRPADSQIIPELIKTKYIEFPSIAVRADLLRRILAILHPEWLGKVIGDTRLILEFAQLSKIGYIPEETTVYRLVQGSASHPVSTGKYLFASNDTYEARRNFVLRYQLNKKWLGLPVCNFNRGLVHKAMEQKNYGKALFLLRHLKIRETFLYCDLKTIRARYDAKIIAKFWAALLGLGALKNAIRKSR